MSNIKKFDQQDKYFYSIMGEHFANKEIIKEMDAQLYNEKNTVWLLYIDDKSHTVQGFVSIHDKGQFHYIDNFYVLEPYRGKKIAHRLLNRAMGELEGKEVKTITRNEITLNMFKKNGFKLDRKNGRYFYLKKV
jgi:GNAT superfamily N-acetyltransferase